MGGEEASREVVHADGLPVRDRVGAEPPTEAGQAEDDAVGEPVHGTDAGLATEEDEQAATPAAGGGEPDAPAPESPKPREPATDGAEESPADRLERLALLLEETQRLLARQTDHVERLHAENQRLRQGELRGALLPLVRDVLRVHDDLARLAAIGETTPADLDIAREGILDALARNGIVAAPATPGEPFDPRRHRAQAPVETDDPGRHRTIAETLRAGFAWDDGAVVRAADVRVFTHVAAHDPASATTTD